MGIVPFVIMMIALLLFMILPQSKRAKQHREMISKLAKGDEVITNGGMAGRVTDIGDSFITLEVASGVQIKFQRAAVSMVLPRGSLKAS